MIRPLVLSVALLPIALAGCDKKPDVVAPKASASPPSAPPSSASAVAPSASGSASALAPATSGSSAPPPRSSPPDGVAKDVDLSGEVACAPKVSEMTGAVATGSSEAAISFCLGSEERAQYGCYALELATGTYKKLPKVNPPKVDAKASTKGAHVIEALDRAVRVCPSAGGGDCVTIELGAYRRGAAIPADVSPDGKKLVVVRDLGGSSQNHTVDIYDLASKARDKRTGIEGRGTLVGPVAWLGKRVMIVSCVEAGPGCTALLWDPETQKSTSASGNVFGVDRPAHPVAPPVWGFVSGTGSEIGLVDVDTGAKKPSVALPLASDVQNGVAVIPRSPGQIAIVAGAPQAGAVAIVDLAPSPKLVKKYAMPACKR